MKKTKFCSGNTYWKGRSMHPFVVVVVVVVVVAICFHWRFFLIRLISAHAFSLFLLFRMVTVCATSFQMCMRLRAAKLFWSYKRENLQLTEKFLTWEMELL